VNVGFVVDGVAEYGSISLLYEQLCAASGNTFLNPVKADIQPLAPVPVIAERCVKPCRQLLLRGANRVIVLMDLEGRDSCPGRLASEIETAIDMAPVAVVVKHSMFENWLLSDLNALSSQRGRFRVSKATRQAVEPNNVDTAKAMDLMKRAVQGDYNKVQDAKRILSQADVLAMAGNSRSFRRMLRVADHERYRNQSRAPARSQPSRRRRRG